MIDITRILCPVDFSDGSRRALDFSIGLARWYGAKVTVLHVAPVPVPPAAFAAGASVMMEPVVLSLVEQERLRADLRAFANARPTSDVEIDVEVTEGLVWREIRDRAAALPAELIVLGTHGRSGFERLLIGSVTEKLLRAAPCAVMTVPPPPAAETAAPGVFKRILCPVDFSGASDVAVRWATAIAQESDADLLLLHVIEEPPTPAGAVPRPSSPEFEAEYDRWCLARLRDAVPAQVRGWCSVHERTVRGVAHAQILAVAAEGPFDLIVMGVSGHRSLGDRVFGSTSQHVVRAAVCPVLAARPQVSSDVPLLHTGEVVTSE
jgi:nucleotide-binding universal stress UspA family protein